METDNKANQRNVKHIRDLKSLLQIHFGDKLIVVNYAIGNLVAPGENLSSDVLKIRAKIQRSKNATVEEHQFVAKTPVDSQLPDDWTCIFKKESFLYNSIIPLYQRIELENGIGKKDIIANIVPKFIGYRLSLNPRIDVADKDAVILLENLRPRGYYVADRKFGMSFQHASLTMKVLARFHALGIVSKRRYPIEFEAIKAMSRLWDFNPKEADVAIPKFVALVKRDPRFRNYAGRIERIAERWLPGDSREQLLRHEVWSTVAHNDVWTNNVLFHDDEATGQVDDVKLIDFQTYRFVDVFVDLTFFLGTSLDEKVESKHLNELLEIYHGRFVGVLRGMGLDDDELSDFSREKFDERLKEAAGNEFLHIVVALTPSTADITNDAASFKKLMELLKIYEERDWLH